MKLFDIFKKKSPVSVMPKGFPTRRNSNFDAIIKMRSQLIQATNNRLNASWYRLNLQSADDTFTTNVDNLRKLSRRMTLEDAITKSWYEALVTNVIGAHGVRFVPKIRRGKTPAAGLNETVNSQLKKAWKEWERVCTVTRKTDWIGLQEQLISTVSEDGEAFINVIIDRNVNKYGMALEVMDAALLDHDYNITPRVGNKIRQGIELDSFDRPVAYHFWTHYPNSRVRTGSTERVRVPALNLDDPGVQGGVIHLHYAVNDRVNALRGLPWLTPVINWLARLNQYLDAELIAATMASMAPGVITTDKNDPTPYTEPTFTNVDRDGVVVDSDGALSIPKTPDQESLPYESGILLKLAPGEKIDVPNFDRPNTAMEAATRLYLHAIAAGLGIAYSTLTADNSEESYASGRLGVLQERDQWKRIQQWLVRSFHAPVYDAWIRSALRTSLDLPGPSTEYMDVEFRARGWKWADQLREVKAVIEMHKMGIMPYSMLGEEFGYDYEETVRQTAADRELMEKAGLDPDATLNSSTSAANEPIDGERPAETEQ